jgi:hypothetical protein
MGGSSLLSPPDRRRLIFASGSETASLSRRADQYPFALPGMRLDRQIENYPLLAVMQCQRWVIFDLQGMVASEGEVAGYAQPCPPEMLDSRAALLVQVQAALAQFGHAVPEN